jgi:hypothetical protein
VKVNDDTLSNGYPNIVQVFLLTERLGAGTAGLTMLDSHGVRDAGETGS